MTVTEYNKSVQDKKSEMLEAADKTANSQKQIALVTIGNRMDKFVIKTRDVFEEFGYIVHWYHYSNESLQKLDIGVEIADLRPHYHKVFTFDDTMPFDFSFMAYEVAVHLVDKFNPQSIGVFGNHKWDAQALVYNYIEKNKKISCIPFGHEPFYSSIFENDVAIVCDPKIHINCYPIYKPVIVFYPWCAVNTENRNVYDLSEEIILKVVEERC